MSGTLILVARPHLLALFDRRARRQRVSNHEHLARTLEHVRLADGPSEASHVLVHALRDGIGARAVHVIVDQRGDVFAESMPGVMALRSDTALVAVLREAAGPLDLSPDQPLLALLPKAERAWLEAHDVELAAPLRRRDGTVAAIVMAGGKRGHGAYDERDRWFVRTVAMAAASAWDAEDREATPDDGEAAVECPGCGLVTEGAALTCCGVNPIVAALPRRLGSTFVVQRRLGAGGMGVVYLARDTRLDRDVALKTLPELRPGLLERAGDTQRLRDEARAMAALSHDGLATIHGLELWRRTPVLVMPYFPAGTLAQRLTKGPLAPAAALVLGSRLAQALAHVHAHGLLHRDVKPSNIALTDTGAPKLLDFGLAALVSLSPHVSDPGMGDLVGTAAYLPPEAYRGATPIAAFDLWALAVVLLEAITGRNPFAGEHLAETRDRLRCLDAMDIAGSLDGHHPSLTAFFACALATAPAVRFPTAAAMQAALAAVTARPPRMR